jgi:tRNA (guanine37-N1)-methyltransferase
LLRVEVVTHLPAHGRGPAGGRHRSSGARDKGLVGLRVHDLRAFSEDKHRNVDDAPFGGGPGMVMKVSRS